MKTKTINLYEFSELSETAKMKAIDNLRDINVYYGWWEDVYEDFTTFCSGIGIEIDKINFALSYSQGDGSSFSASIDLPKLIQAIKGKTWLTNYPKETLAFYEVTPNIERVVRLIESGKIDGKCWIAQSHDNAIRFENEYGLIESGLCANPVRVLSVLDDLIYLLEDAAKTLNEWLFNNLVVQYEYCPSDEQIIETIEANGYTFTEDGELENE